MMNRLLSTLVAFFLLLLLPWLALAQQSEAEVDFFVKERPEHPLTVGDQVTLRLEVTHPLQSQVGLPTFEPEWQPFDVITQTAAYRRDNRDGTATTAKEVVVSLYRPGQYQTPAFNVAHQRADGEVEELAAPIIELTVTSVLTEDDTLRDLKPQARVPLPPLWPWLLLGMFLTLILTGSATGVGLLLYQRWKRRPLPETGPAVVIDTRPPELIAYTELDRIEALELPAQNRIKEHYSLVTDCLRIYIENRYRIPAPEQTSYELRNAFRAKDIPMPHVTAFMSLMSESDLVKFARYVPSDENLHSLLNRARRIVDMTTPRPEPAQPETEPEASE